MDTAIIVVLVLVVIYCFHLTIGITFGPARDVVATTEPFSIGRRSFSNSGGREFHALTTYDNSSGAVALVDEMNDRLMRFLKWLGQKYDVSTPGDRVCRNGGGVSMCDRQRVVQAILYGYNTEELYETDPLNRKGDTSYTQEKGDKMYLCVRNKRKPSELTPINTMMFVSLHEIAHIGHYDGWGHPTRFWQIFKFILSEATTFGIYTPEEYVTSPVWYCSLKIDYQPLFDDQLIMI